MKINPNDPKWTAYVLGELDEHERAEIEQLLESSSEARALVDELRIATTMLKDELVSQPAINLHAAQRAAIRAAASPKVRQWSGIRVASWATGLAAAGLILAVVIPSSFRPSVPAALAPAARDAAELNAPEDQRSNAESSIATNITPEPESSRAAAAGADVDSQLIVPADEVINERTGQSPDIVKDTFEADIAVPPARFEDQTELARLRNDALQDLSQDKEKRDDSALQGRQAAAEVEVQANAALSKAEVDTRVREAAGGRVVAPAGPPVPAAAPPARALAAAAPAPPPPVVDRIYRPSFNTEAYDRITDNPFLRVSQEPLSTFSIDVDTASYANLRRFLNQNQLPPRDAVRIEEMINYFTYDYPQPSGPHPILAQMEVASAPWNPQHRLVRIGIKGKDLDLRRRPSSNLVFLIDVSGSMQPAEKLPLLKNAMRMLVQNLNENDRVSMVVYAGASGMALPPTSGDRKGVILRALDNLEAGGSTNGASGIQLAYNLAVANYIPGGTNRVILATDGDFNVGVTNQGDLIRLIEDKAKSGVFLSVLGFGLGNLKDSTLEKLADSGNGNYAYIDTPAEARKVLVEQMAGTPITIAKDVKIQIEFNPARVNAYRLIGYENRVLRNEDFNNDQKDAGDMGAGHTVTALFEVVPSGVDVPSPGVDPLKYQTRSAPVRSSSRETLTLKIRYQDPEGSQSKLLEVPLVDSGRSFNAASTDYRFAASVAAFGMILRDSPYKGSTSLGAVLDMAEGSKGQDRNGYRQEFIGLVNRARALMSRDR